LIFAWHDAGRNKAGNPAKGVEKMNATRTDEASWTERERELAEEIRADGGDVKVTIKNGRRVFSIMAAEDGTRPTLHMGGAVKIRNTKPSLRVVRGVRG
jgi:hypothetical protein